MINVSTQSALQRSGVSLDVEGGEFVIDDYDVTFAGLSPYVHAEFSPTERLRLSGGLRFDGMRYDYQDRLAAPDSPRYLRPADASVTHRSVSPKVGATYQVSQHVNAFASYRRGFRVPSESQIFRPGSTRDTVNLAPVKAHNVEAGLRVTPTRRLSIETAVYRLDKRDDILSYRDPFDGQAHTLNAGQIAGGMRGTARRDATET